MIFSIKAFIWIWLICFFIHASSFVIPVSPETPKKILLSTSSRIPNERFKDKPFLLFSFDSKKSAARRIKTTQDLLSTGPRQVAWTECPTLLFLSFSYCAVNTGVEVHLYQFAVNNQYSPGFYFLTSQSITKYELAFFYFYLPFILVKEIDI